MPFCLEYSEDAEHADDCCVWDLRGREYPGEGPFNEEREGCQAVAYAAPGAQILDATPPAVVLVALPDGPQAQSVLKKEDKAD
eukprot:scaffold14931_cov44-Prasinocladus_malaysianus.AAC.1